MIQSTEGIDQFLKKKDEQIQFQNRMLQEALSNTLKGRDVKEELSKKTANAELTQRVFLQRQTRVINDLFDIFFSAECQKVYKPLLKLRVSYETRKIQPIDKPADYEKISIALGHVAQLCIHFGTALQLVYNHHMIFNGKKSLIFFKEPASDFVGSSKLIQHKLFFSQRAENAALT